MLPLSKVNASVVIRVKVKKCEQTLLFALLRIHIIGSQRLERFAPPSLPPHLCNPATRDFKSSILIEALLRGCHLHLDVQSLPPSSSFHPNDDS